MIVFDHDVCPTLIFLLEEVLRFALGVHIYVHNCHYYMSGVEGHSYMSRLSKHVMFLFKVVVEHSFQVSMPNSLLIFLQESRSTTQGFILAIWLGCVLMLWGRGWSKLRHKNSFWLFQKIQSLDFFIIFPPRIYEFDTDTLHDTRIIGPNKWFVFGFPGSRNI